MKLLLIFVLIHATGPLLAQKFDGEYATQPGVYGESITFNDKDKTFALKHYNCNLSIEGKGSYTIKGKILQLHFEKKPQLPAAPGVPGKQPIVNNKPGNYKIDVRVVEDQDTTRPVENISIHLKGTTTGAVTNKEGIASVEYTSSKDLALEVSGPLVKMQTVTLKENGQYSITLYLQYLKPEIIYLNNGEIYTYKIDKHRGEEIELSMVYSTGENGPVWKYRKRRPK
jgi:hypothetical protein